MENTQALEIAQLRNALEMIGQYARAYDVEVEQDDLDVIVDMVESALGR